MRLIFLIKLLSFLDFGSSIKFLILDESIFCTKAKTRSLFIPFPSNTFKESDSVKDIDFTGE